VSLRWFSKRKASLTLRQRRQYQVLTEHLTSGFRVRQALLQLRNLTNNADSSPVDSVPGCSTEFLSRRAPWDGGRVLDAPWDNPLSARESPPDSIALWDAFIWGEYSLVEAFDSRRMRFLLVASTSASALTRLTAQEHAVVVRIAAGTSNKSIGADLGIVPGSVTTHLHSGLKKLGFANREQLIPWLNARRFQQTA
jgi:DNA-binding CsgD family transcriptional regulator